MTAVPTGVYTDQGGHSAVVVRVVKHSVWFVNILSGKVETYCWSVERFLSRFSRFLSDYPVRRALRIYQRSLLEIDEQTAKLLNLLLKPHAQSS